MDNKIIDGKKLALKHEKVLKKKIQGLVKKPKIISVLIGDDPASLMYSKMKQRKAADLGIDFELLNIPPRGWDVVTRGWDVVTQEIKRLNQDPKIDGIMIQLPVPNEFLGNHRVEELLNLIDPKKDVDGLNYAHKGTPCVPAAVRAILAILKDEGVEVKNKKVAVLGRSKLVGKPVAEQLQKMGAKVLVGHSQTLDLKEITKDADIIISAVGKANLVTGEMIKKGVVIIDVGTSKLNGKIVGDVDFKSVTAKAVKITPVPGGVGPMTIISLMENVVELAHGNV